MAKIKKICIVVQGPLISKGLNAYDYLEEKYNDIIPSGVTAFYSRDYCDFYDSLLDYFDDIVFSTWEGEEGFGDYSFIYNEKVAPNIAQGGGLLMDNGNLQSISSLNGILYFQEKYGDECIVVKIRSDLIFEVDTLYNACEKITNNKINPLFLMGFYSIDDMVVAGKLRNMREFYTSSLVKKPPVFYNSHFSYVFNYIRCKYEYFPEMEYGAHDFLAWIANELNAGEFKELPRLIGSFYTNERKMFVYFNNSFEPLLERNEFDSLELSWRGRSYKDSSLYRKHFNLQMFRDDNDFMKKVEGHPFLLFARLEKYKIKQKIKHILGKIRILK